MAIERAKYRVYNGTNFDEIHFKTSADLVEIKDTAGKFTATEVEGALKENADKIGNLTTSKADKSALETHLAESATTSQKGHVQLSSSTSSTSTSLAATASAVKTVNDALTSHKAENVTQGDNPHGIIYEKGVWNPVICGTTSGQAIMDTSTTGRYIRSGDLVTVWFYARISDKNGITGNIRVYGLPYAVQGDTASDVPIGSCDYYVGSLPPAEARYVFCFSPRGINYTNLQWGLLNNVIGLADNEIDDNFKVIGTMTYKV
jgi:hypothetical protein